jgi:hypothetical protein
LQLALQKRGSGSVIKMVLLWDWCKPQHTATGAAATSSTHNAAAEAFSNTMHKVSSMVTDHTALLSEAVEHW